MFYATVRRLCSAGVASQVMKGQSTSDSQLEPFLKFLREKNALFDAVEVRPSPETGRGLFSKCVIQEGSLVASVPLETLSVSAERLLAASPTLQAMKPPTFDDVRRVMAARSVRDAALYEQVYLALLVAGEHLNPDSPLNRYFNLLPHPAMDDALVIRRHKETLDPMLLVEWDDYQKEFLAILHILLKKWGPQAPPIEVAYWAFRTVLSRMHLLPHKGMAPEDVGSSLNYTALTVFDEADRQTRWTKRIKTMLGMALGNINAAQEFYLVPTLVPLIDMTGHLPSSNVQVEVHKRKGLGSCVELQAVRLIEKGEEIGLRYNTSQSPAFLMYRFGFIPQ